MKKLYFSALIIFLLSAGQAGYAQISGFNAYPENNIVMLRWQTGNEGNTDHFVVEHSLDNIHFAPLHEVVALGTVGSGSFYDDADSYPDAMTNYYRVKEVTKDGQAFYSAFVKVDMTGKPLPVLKPTLLYLGSTLQVDKYYDQPLIVDFFNAQGMKMASYLVNGSSFNIRTASWGKGLYYYRISDPSHPLINAGKIVIL